MDERHKEALSRVTGGKVRFNCPMSPYTTLGVGGRAEALVRSENVREVQQILAYAGAEGIPCVPVGRGSNLLVTDGGIDGLVILMGDPSIERIRSDSGAEALDCGAGLSLAVLLRVCLRWGLAGLEFLAGIPGSVGGAVAMNAGAFGGEIGNEVLEVEFLTGAGEGETRKREQLRFSYRSFDMEPGWVIVRVRLRVAGDRKAAVASRIAEFRKRRRRTQPAAFRSAGSVFKNPPGDYAGRLIESVGLKGKRIGGAMISPQHANYIVNTGEARARDVLDLIELARKTVKMETGVDLKPEIRVVGR